MENQVETRRRIYTYKPELGEEEKLFKVTPTGRGTSKIVESIVTEKELRRRLNRPETPEVLT